MVKEDGVWERIRKFRPDWLTLVLLGLIVYFWYHPPAWVSYESRPAPQLHATLLDGQRVGLEQLRGRVVLINFWASWCVYCRREMPDMEQFWRDYRSQGFDILALSQDDTPVLAREFIEKEGYHFPVAMADADHAAALGGVSRLPTSFLIDRHGRVRHKISGQVHYDRLENLVKPLLAEK